MQKVNVDFYHTADDIKALSLTPAATLHIKKMLSKQQANRKSFRLSLKRSGCSGFSYVVDYVKTFSSYDLEFPIDDLVVFVDKASFPYLKGVCIDYVQNGINGALKFINPNQTAICGCGESFSIEKEK